jgi:hypothetical protein
MGQLKLDLVSKIPKVDFEYGLDESYSPIYLQNRSMTILLYRVSQKLQTKHEGKQLLETNEGKYTQFRGCQKKNPKAEHD